MSLRASSQQVHRICGYVADIPQILSFLIRPTHDILPSPLNLQLWYQSEKTFGVKAQHCYPFLHLEVSGAWGLILTVPHTQQALFSSTSLAGESTSNWLFHGKRGWRWPRRWKGNSATLQDVSGLKEQNINEVWLPAGDPAVISMAMLKVHQAKMPSRWMHLWLYPSRPSLVFLCI